MSVRRLLAGARLRVGRTRHELTPRVLLQQCDARALDALNRRHYRMLSVDELRATRRTDSVFVFGSGSSLNEISPCEWEHFGHHDTLSFNWFPRQRWIRIDYHLIREVATHSVDFDPRGWKPVLAEYAELLRASVHYQDTVFVVQSGWRAVNGNRLVGRRLLPPGARVFRFRNRPPQSYEPPSESFEHGLVHSGAMTLGDCVNFAYLTGWRSIVLVGVDMYDHRYFWLPPDKAREDIDLHREGVSLDDPFRAASTVLETLRAWNEIFSARGVRLFVHNPRSLLARVLPVYEPPPA